MEALRGPGSYDPYDWPSRAYEPLYEPLSEPVAGEPIMSSLEALLQGLHQARSFEQAAERTLEVVLDEVGRVAQGADAHVLRGMVHLRPDDTYEGIAVREVGEGGAARFMPSTTAWRWVAEARDAVLLDVRAGRVRASSGAVLTEKAARRADFRSRSALLGREASLIIALPLRRPGGRVDGFVSVELAAPGALDAWPAPAPGLQTLADVAASFLCELPRAPREALRGDAGLPVIGQRMRVIIEDLKLFAEMDETILLQGETGVGKSRLARWCWQQSARSARRFVRVDLSEVPAELRESALFGWSRGAFTGAVGAHAGYVADAEGGTLFIDEIDKLPLRGQSMLLSLMDEGKFRVIGENEVRQADVRFMVGTNANLEEAVAEGRFLEDLYYRIRVMPMRILPLRQRRDEIVPWAEYMIAKLHRGSKGPGEARLEAAAGRRLEGLDWPGNLRHLESVVKRAYTFARRDAQGGGEVWVRVAHMEHALAFEAKPSPDALRKRLERAAAAFVDQALVREDGLQLEHAGALRHFVLEEAMARLGRQEGFRVLGREKSLRSGNGAKVVEQERKHWHALAEALGLDPRAEPGGR